MNKTEALQYLNLPDHSSETEIKRVYSEKYNHFQYLLTHAPNDLLRNIHRKNLEQLDQVRLALGITLGAVVPPAPLPSPAPGSMAEASGGTRPRPAENNEPVGWLIRHTEQKSPIHFALWARENPIGRSVVVNKRSIQLEDDQYVSRHHATLVATLLPVGYAFEIADDGRYNQGQPSRNGTYINGSDSRLGPAEVRLLKDGDTVQIGATKLVLRVNQGAKTVSGLVDEVVKTQFVRTVVIDL